ncbi:uncharacterized protein CcaverHIS019_0705080 [Cutaneotrichosporon cavernicola]|uniref:Uncharacterized protein n=1 Tax=Cutaneotrichosporon cavernicola TaxID=279322 RepID=A0AA48LAH8_9TREE|nr:uncharacterized protein CcaverHIS019_0705080 [Cutaneotrichosporon cavernicola]BEI94927.1 hypothetical protein CcaverHIS019_0705080 [Cutaneotrichosporon cavernicola]
MMSIFLVPLLSPLTVRFAHRNTHVDEAYSDSDDVFAVLANLSRLFEPAWRPLPGTAVKRMVVNTWTHPGDRFEDKRKMHPHAMWGTQGLAWDLGASADEIHPRGGGGCVCFQPAEQPTHAHDGHPPNGGRKWGHDNMVPTITNHVIDRMLTGIVTTFVSPLTFRQVPWEADANESDDDDGDDDGDGSVDGLAAWPDWGAERDSTKASTFRSNARLRVYSVRLYPEVLINIPEDGLEGDEKSQADHDYDEGSQEALEGEDDSQDGLDDEYSSEDDSENDSEDEDVDADEILVRIRFMGLDECRAGTERLGSKRPPCEGK